MEVGIQTDNGKIGTGREIAKTTEVNPTGSWDVELDNPSLGLKLEIRSVSPVRSSALLGVLRLSPEDLAEHVEEKIFKAGPTMITLSWSLATYRNSDLVEMQDAMGEVRAFD